MPRRVLTPTPEDLATAAAVLAGGGLVLVPTETVYGIVARADQPSAVAALILAKGRPEGKPLQVLVASADEALGLAGGASPAATALARAFWPGPLTLVMAAGPTLPAEVVAGDGTVGLRCPGHDALRSLLALAGPLAASSANLSGEPPAADCAEALAALGGAVALAIDDGPARGGVPSTVVRAVGDGVTVLRQGAISAAQIEAVADART